MKFFKVFLVLNVLALYDANPVSQGVNDFSLSFLQKVHSETDNLIFSPTSICMAFGMLLKGARRHTAEEIKQVLQLGRSNDEHIHQKLYEIITTSSRPNLTLDYNNMALMNVDMNHNVEYENFLRTQYQAHFESVDFEKEKYSLLQRVNDFVSNKTRGLISKILEEPLPDRTKLLLINTLYFHGSWKIPFIKQATKKHAFYNSNKQASKVDTMFREAMYKSYEDRIRKFTLLELPYEGNVSMYIVLPKERYGLKSVLEQVFQQHHIIEEAIKGSKSHTYRLFVPKFKFQAKPDLKNALRRLGASRMFDRDADLSGISSDTRLYVSDAFHKAVIEVDETSTKAAAVTGIAVGVRSSLPRLTPVLRVDHPFLFFIRDRLHNVNLFMGLVQNL